MWRKITNIRYVNDMTSTFSLASTHQLLVFLVMLFTATSHWLKVLSNTTWSREEKIPPQNQNQFSVHLCYGKPSAIVFPPITMGSLLKSPAVQARSTWGKQMRKVKIKNANKKRVRVNNAKYVSAFSFCGCPPHTKMFFLFMILSRNMLTFLHFSLS